MLQIAPKKSWRQNADEKSSSSSASLKLKSNSNFFVVDEWFVEAFALDFAHFAFFGGVRGFSVSCFFS